MRVFMLLAKLMMLAFWLTVILSLLGLVEVPNPQRLHLIALIVLGVHVVECLLMYRKLKKLGSTGLHLLQVMVFGVLQEREDWTFTRQELGQLATTARREREEAEAEREAFKKAREEAEAAAVIMPDGTAVPSAKGPVQVQPKRKKSGAGKATKKLLKHLRKIAEVAHDAGLM